MEHYHRGLEDHFPSKWVICRFHVNLPGCNFPRHYVEQAHTLPNIASENRPGPRRKGWSPKRHFFQGQTGKLLGLWGGILMWYIHIHASEWFCCQPQQLTSFSFESSSHHGNLRAKKPPPSHRGMLPEKLGEACLLLLCKRYIFKSLFFRCHVSFRGPNNT